MKKLIVAFLVVLCASCQSQIDDGAIYASDTERFRQNIATKAMGDDYVVYEYKDVRIDDVATLASRYCYETNPNKKAFLRDIYMHKNHKRRVTFDCVDLASE